MRVRSGKFATGLTALVVFLVVPPGLAVSAVDAPGDSVLAETSNVVISTSGDWINYDYTQELLASEEKTYYGTQLSDGSCHFSGEETFDPSEEDFHGIIEEREIARNLEECIMVTETGGREDSVASMTLTQEGADGGDEQTEVEEAIPVDEGEGEPIPPPRYESQVRRAGHSTFYEDPPGFNVNSVTTKVRWRYNGNCVTDSWSHVSEYHWLSGTGWEKIYSNTDAGRRCAYARTTSNSRFRNTAFCLSVDTYTRYTPNVIRGREDGTYWMAWDANAWGGCSGLLSFHRFHSYF